MHVCRAQLQHPLQQTTPRYSLPSQLYLLPKRTRLRSAYDIGPSVCRSVRTLTQGSAHNHGRKTMSYVHSPPALDSQQTWPFPIETFSQGSPATLPVLQQQERKRSSWNNTSSTFLITHGPRPTCVYCFLPRRCSCHA